MIDKYLDVPILGAIYNGELFKEADKYLWYHELLGVNNTAEFIKYGQFKCLKWWFDDHELVLCDVTNACSYGKLDVCT